MALRLGTFLYLVLLLESVHKSDLIQRRKVLNSSMIGQYRNEQGSPLLRHPQKQKNSIAPHPGPHANQQG